MRIDIVGAGAIGLLFAGELSAAGHNVHLWTRTEEQADWINRHGIELEHHNGLRNTVKTGIEAGVLSRGWAEKAEGSAWVLLAVKQRHLTSGLLDSLAFIKESHVPVVCLQNGMGHLDRLASYLSRDQLYAAVTTEGAKKLSANQVIRSNPGQTRLGSPFEADPVKLTEIADVLGQAGFGAQVAKDIEREMHRKLLMNAAINPLTALWRIPNGELLTSEYRRGALEGLISEALAIYERLGIPYDADIGEQIKEVCRTTSGNISSMLADVQRGEETEVDFINGYLVEMAGKAGMSAPAHEWVWRLIKGLSNT
ncbi:ketopantoate reductase family protein [Paenibacillus physcomitrellae]|uniref:2-dehydropantoate 2-reductase n=1 Tax=Paenibacillus physcomitrellae TaxID=1619311 RepID=A0ABQ1FNC0_9BACL|nr:2-dehydropantoate 2-reductase [Paenibacillus physcomitrellae]GGA20726.1 2-dehydropantoate 2-reductase [Paenibacillus physcomitrellae]